MPARLARSAAALAAAALALLSPRGARAERELIVPFHDGGTLVLDQLSGLRVAPTSGAAYAGPVGVALRTTTSEALTAGGAPSETSTTSLWLAPSADVFVTAHLSLGALVEVAHTWGAVEDADQRIELPGATSYTLLPRVGFFVPFTDRIGLWPRAGLGFTSAESSRFASSGGAVVRETLRAMVLDVDLSLVYRFGETFFMRAGPEIGVTLGGRRTEESAGVSAGAGKSVLQFSGVVGFGMNVEL